MLSDPIVDEVRKARQDVAAPFGENIHEFFEHIRQRERQSDASVVTLKPNAPEQLVQTIPRR